MLSHQVTPPPKAASGDRIAVLSPSFAAPGAFPQIHTQAMQRLREVTGLVPVEYPTTRQVGASPAQRAHDLNTAFADPSIRAVIATIGGDDQIRVIGHLDPDLARADPKPFLGYSDNTHLHHWLWTHGIGSYYGGSTQVHLGPGPGVEPIHVASLRAALLDGGTLDLADPGYSQDFGIDWADPRALTETGEYEPTTGYAWAGPTRMVTGPTWGGCLEVLDWILMAGRFTCTPDSLAGAILLIETSELLPSAQEVTWRLRAMGERGLLGPLAGVLAARPPVSDVDRRPEPAERERLRWAQAEAIMETVGEYNPDAVVCAGVPFGHTAPQWIIPHGGAVTLDPERGTVTATY